MRRAAMNASRGGVVLSAVYGQAATFSAARFLGIELTSCCVVRAARWCPGAAGGVLWQRKVRLLSSLPKLRLILHSPAAAKKENVRYRVRTCASFDNRFQVCRLNHSANLTRDIKFWGPC